MNKKINYYFLSIFIIELIIYISFLYLEFNKNNINNYLKYSLIIINFLFGLIYLIKNYFKEKLFLVLGLFFTIESDYFLLFKNSNKEYCIGISIFIIVQLMYFIYNFLSNKLYLNEIIIEIIIRIFLIIVSLIFVYYFLNKYFNLVNVLAISYFINLLINFLECIFFFKRNKKRNIILIIGFLLFILCDLSVGLYNLKLIDAFKHLMWIAYAPSQFLLLYSIKE